MRSQRFPVAAALLALAAIGALLLTPNPSLAGDKRWIGGSDWWDYGDNWNPAGQPGDGDNVYLSLTGPGPVWYWNTSYPSAVLNSLHIGYTMTLDQGYEGYAHPLASNKEYVGENGTGTHLQSRGTNTISDTLYLGYWTYAHGFYELSGSGSLSANNQHIGYWGTGLFKQSGGTNAVTGDLRLGSLYGSSSSSSGTYELSGSGSLSANNQYIGYEGTGVFKQTGAPIP